MKAMYIIGIILENIYRCIRAMVPAMVMCLVLVLNPSWNTAKPIYIIFASLVVLGGFLHEFKVVDLFKE
jgi:hypothetical protein